MVIIYLLLHSSLVVYIGGFSDIHCASNQYFDSILGSCETCRSSLYQEPDNGITDVNGNSLRCKCMQGYERVDNDCTSVTNGNCISFNCKSCLIRGNTSYADNSGCVLCSAKSTVGLDNNTLSAFYHDCECPTSSTNSYTPKALVERSSLGNKLNEKYCSTCPMGELIITKDTTIAGVRYSADEYNCRSCPDTHMTMTYDQRGYSCDCNSGYTKVGQALIGAQSCVLTSQASNFLTVETVSSATTFSRVGTVQSLTILHYFTNVATHCMYYGGPEDNAYCQALVNLCALKFYDLSGSAVCGAYLTISKQRPYSVGHGKGLPWLFYSSNTAACRDTSLKMSVTLTNTVIKYVVAAYSLDGSWLGYSNLSTLFAYCERTAPHSDEGGGASATTKYLLFGTTVKSSYSCSPSSLLQSSQIFYDLFIEDTATGSLYPVPVKVTNLLVSGATPNTFSVNALCSSNDVFVRRFFLYDIVSGITASSAPLPAAIRYASTINLAVEIQKNNPKNIYVPVLTLTFNDLPTPPTGDTTVSYTVTGTYSMDMSTYLSTDLACLSVAIVLSVLLFFIRFFNWRGRNLRVLVSGSDVAVGLGMSGSQSSVNGFSALEALSLLLHSFVIVLFPYLVIECEYWFVFFKLQSDVSVLLEPPLSIYSSTSSYVRFVVLLHCLVFAQAIHVSYMVYKQSNADLFFVDWEPLRGPGEDIGTGVGAGTEGDGSSGHVSVWRSILIANEWSELQTARRVDPRFCLLWIGFFLVGLQYQYNATQRPNLSDKSPGLINPVLRFGNSVWWWIVTICVQWVWRVLVYERLISEPPEQTFIDLCTLSKVSILVLDEPFHGYYLHCRSTHRSADVSMSELTAALRKEESGLTVDRSLEGAPPDAQSFEMYLTAEWRRRYDRIRQDMQSEGLGRGGRGRDRFRRKAGLLSGGGEEGSSSASPSGPSAKAWQDMTAFIQEFVENNLIRADLRRVIRPASLWQSVTGYPPDLLLPAQPCVFQPDSSLRYTSLLFLGREIDLLLFDILVYSICDLWFGETSTSMLLCYLADRLVTHVRQTLGEAGIARRTHVDRRFLI